MSRAAGQLTEQHFSTGKFLYPRYPPLHGPVMKSGGLSAWIG
jgi:hypothetical protein